MSTNNEQGQIITFSGLPPGRLVRRRHGAQARGVPLQHPGAAQKRRGGAAGRHIPLAAGPLQGFDRFVMNQLNQRLAQFIAARGVDRMVNPDIRVARNLAALFNAVLFPGVGEVLRITQQELAYRVACRASA